MRTFDTPTVSFSIDVYVPTDTPGMWVWRPWTDHPPSRDYVYTLAELSTAMRTHATITAHVLPPAKFIRFRVVALGLLTGRMCGDHEWFWDDRLQRYLPAGDPWVHRPNPAELPADVVNLINRLRCSWTA